MIETIKDVYDIVCDVYLAQEDDFVHVSFDLLEEQNGIEADFVFRGSEDNFFDCGTIEPLIFGVSAKGYKPAWWDWDVVDTDLIRVQIQLIPNALG